MLLAGLFAPAIEAASADRKKMRFAADMAKRGAWREAGYRWGLLLDSAPDDPRLLNNLAVAHEVLGEVERAREFYDRALAANDALPSLRANRGAFERFWSNARPELGWDEEGASFALSPRRAKGKDGKTLAVSVGLPVPPKLSIDEEDSILVASFRHQESDLLDVNRELVRFIRHELRKFTPATVPDISPPPAIPEQSLEDLIANDEFWQYLGRTFDSNIAISGITRYERADVSGFRDVDIVSDVTGQKVRRTQFVEQEEFILVLDLIFMDARDGSLLHRDRLKRGVIFAGLSNDPISAFYELGGTIVEDVLAVVTTRTRQDSRTIYR